LNNDECHQCSICHRIDNNNFTELKIIKPDGLWIKKDQLIELQEEFRMKSLEGNKKVYIIDGAEKLNSQAANSILKFLEEPEPNIIALLITSDVHNVLPTIVSRCQVVSLKGSDDGESSDINFDSISNKTLIKIGKLYYKDSASLISFVNDAKSVAKLDAIVLFIKKYEAMKFDVIIEIKKLWTDHFTEKDDYLWALEIMSLVYKDVLNMLYGRTLEVFDFYKETITFIAEHNKVNDIIGKLQKILSTSEKVKYNINLNLLMDKLIIDMEGGV
jgi:DNA polymerase-3 subunit delta'